MSIYKKTCSETNKVYYGSTSNNLSIRKSKGHYHCACKDFINPIMEIIEDVSHMTKDERLLRENYYILNFECVNINVAIQTEENKKNKDKKWREENKDKLKLNKIKYSNKIKEEGNYHCAMCDFTYQSQKKLERHIDGYRHQLKEECFKIFGSDWKDNYYKFKQQKHEETRRNKKKLPVNLS